LSEVQNGMAMQKFPMFTKGADAIRTTLKKMNIHLSDGWCGCVICPESADPRDAGYEPGLDPSAESVGEQILSLPTHPTMSKKQAILLATILDPLLHTK
jgi:dTDP-4-amino-4,6-dideoxygalactose transaminase